MPGEFPGELGRDFLHKVCFFLDGKFGFDVYRTCYEGKGSTTVVANNEVIRFDFLMYQLRKRTLGDQQTERYRVHFFCECKWRNDPRDLRGKLKEFLLNALKTTPVLQRQFSENFHFLFICNKPFGISQEDLRSIDFLKDFLDDNANLGSLQGLSNKVGILILPDWFLETTSLGA